MVTCTASNADRDGTQTATDTTQIQVIGSPDVSIAPSADQAISTGGSLTLSCTAQDCTTTSFVYMWYRDGVNVESGTSLSISGASSSHFGRYECNVTGDGGTGSAVIYISEQNSLTLTSELSAPPNPSLSTVEGSSVDHYNIEPQAAFSISCTFESPNDFDLEASKDGAVLSTDPASTSTLSSPTRTSKTLTIQLSSFSTSDSGVYQCNASNSERELLSRRVLLTTVLPHVTGLRLTLVKAPGEAASIRVEWNKPSRSLALIVARYDVHYKKSNAEWSSAVTKVVHGANAMETSITNLQRASYDVRISVLYNAGFGTISATATLSTIRVPSRISPPVLSRVVLSGVVALRVSWSEPQSDRPVTTYQLQYRRTSNDSWMSEEVSLTWYTIPYLDPGAEYAVKVRAFSAAGVGQFSSERRLRTYRVPSKVNRPTVSKTVSGGPALRVRWSRPASERVIARYEVQYRRSTNGTWNPLLTLNGTALTLRRIIRDLEPGTGYSVRVRAVSDVGPGPYSDQVTQFVYAVPRQVSRPALSRAVLRGPALVIRWTKPISELTIKHYGIQYKLTSSSAWSLAPVEVLGAADTLEHVLPGLMAGTSYDVQVRAKSSVGVGAYSVKATERTFRVPSSIATVSVSQLSSLDEPALRVSWQRPISEVTISRYDVGHKLRTSNVWTVTTLKGASSTSATIRNVALSALYDIRVRAISTVGPGAYSQTTGYYYSVPSAPHLLWLRPAVSSSSAGLTAQWRPAGSERPITGYLVQYRRSSGSSGWQSWEEVAAAATNTTVDRLEQGTRYRVRVAATSDVGTGPPSAEIQATTYGVPFLTEVDAYPLPKPGSVRLTWTRAQFTQPAVKLQGYSIRYRKVTEQDARGGDFKKQLFNSTTMVVSVGDTVSAEVHGLNLGDVYDVKVALLTNAGIGEYSELVNVTTYPDSCSQCSEIRAVTFVTFQADRMKVSEEQSVVLVDVYRQGPMETPLTLRVKDVPGTAKRGSDYLLQSRDVVFLNTDQKLEKTSIVVRIRNDEVVEQGGPESFTLVLYSDDVDSRVVFTVSELSVSIKDDD